MDIDSLIRDLDNLLTLERDLNILIQKLKNPDLLSEEEKTKTITDAINQCKKVAIYLKARPGYVHKQ